MWPLNELWILTLEASYIRFEPRWRSETKCTTVTQPEEAYYTTVDEASPLTPLKYTFMIHNTSNCAHRSHLHPFFCSLVVLFLEFLVGGWMKNTQDHFLSCHDEKHKMQTVHFYKCKR